MLTFGTLPDEAIVEARLEGGTDESEMKALREECERVARERGGVKMLFVFKDMGKVSFGTVVEGIKADLELFSDLEKLAVVTDKGWYQRLTGITSKPFSFETETFDLGERDAALAWLRG